MKKFIKNELEYRKLKKQIKKKTLSYDFNPLIEGVIESHIELLPSK